MVSSRKLQVLLQLQAITHHFHNAAQVDNLHLVNHLLHGSLHHLLQILRAPLNLLLHGHEMVVQVVEEAGLEVVRIILADQLNDDHNQLCDRGGS